ncbi:hypothetical protein SLW70_12250 [Flavobacterium sp. NG2]|uniref:hypothetical protein n=1 Tax=Flavobacterium sp. NG2 TaxID=3097547 RepID=UPI002A8033AE|nr:hypothetical protein [Flavobacterium sp. NG2]WPR70700.1 hypothetical protein SLW70_12250 [Flavobacterium sp. NG2]
MTTSTILLILVSLLVAGGLSYFQYLYKAKNNSKLNLFLAFLRFLSFFSILLLLINPMITKNTLEIVKPTLAVVVDNSSSITHLNGSKASLDTYRSLVSNKDLQEKYTIQSLQFDADCLFSESFDFKGTQTNLDAVAKNLKNTNRNQNYPTVLITDGNQTSGNDYVYSFGSENSIFPVVIGDTTKVLDLKINQLNVNKYAFFKNKFPVEVFLGYSGTKNVQAEFSIRNGNSILVKQTVSFSSTKKTAVINVLLPADRVGTQVYKATITSVEKEKNIYNNTKNFAVEIIDQKTSIAIVSAISHPDIGALKRAIESNQQRKVTIVKPNDIKTLEDISVVMFYQPTSEFKSVFEKSKLSGINSFIITGMHTDFNFLNQQQDFFDFKMSNQQEDYLAGFNPQFNNFAIENIGFENLPPLENPFGKITTKGNIAVLLSSKIRNIDTNAPLLSFTENQGKRMAFLFGENSWKWRLTNTIDNQSADRYDVFIDKTIQFLASNNTKKSLVVQHENFYNSGEGIEISAQYFNKNYEFDEKAHLTISVSNNKTKQTKNYDLLKTNNAYKVNLDGLGAGNYTFTVKELNSNSNYSGKFEVLDFEIEKQFVNPDNEKLNQLATQTGGKVYYPNQISELIHTLVNDENYKTIQKNKINRSPLIEWYWLLIMIAGFLSVEWFVRKYNGLL